MKNLIIRMLFVSALFSPTKHMAQIKALVNEVATKVDHTNGQITAVHETYPNYMDGFEKAPNDIFHKVPPRIQPDKEMRSQVNVIDKWILDSSLASNDRNKQIRRNAIFFNSDSSQIQSNSVRRVQNFARKIISGQMKSVVLKSWFKVDDLESRDLVQERLEACKLAMVENGVPSNLILTSILSSDQESRFVTVMVQ
ncbi:MAG: hypothetical protein HKN51_15540 [Saprospiraceae bacterium]|nr:hypothetical protein [Saprospiraceae bacterium]